MTYCADKERDDSSCKVSTLFLAVTFFGFTPEHLRLYHFITRTRSPSERATVDARLWPRGGWDSPKYRSMNLLIYLLTPWSGFRLEKLTDFHLVKKFPAFYGTRRFITAFTSARHLSLSWASSIHSTPPTSHVLKIYLNTIFPHTPGSTKWSLYFRFPHQNPVYASSLPHTRYMPHPSHSSRFYHPSNSAVWIRIPNPSEKLGFESQPLLGLEGI
jgi:hypothetical protein